MSASVAGLPSSLFAAHMVVAALPLPPPKPAPATNTMGRGEHAFLSTQFGLEREGVHEQKGY